MPDIPLLAQHPAQHRSSLSKRPKLSASLPLFLLALINYGLMYAANILLARALDVEAFDDYSVAVSIVTMLSTLTTLGLEKYALRAISLFQDRMDWPAYRGYWIFSLLAILGFSLILIALVGISLELFHTLYDTELHLPIILFSSFLPFIALSLFLVEVLAAHGSFFISVSIYRLFLPALYLSTLFLLLNSNFKVSAVTAVICLGSSWTATFGILWAICQFVIPAAVRHAQPELRIKKWLKRAIPLVMNSLLMTMMTSGGVVIMQLLYTGKIEVGIYAVAAQTGAFISLVGTSTNRYFLPMLVVAIEHRDLTALHDIIRKKSAIVGSLILSLLAVVFCYGKAILHLFGGHYDQGDLTLGIIASGASVSAFFADIPYYLQFMGMHRIVLQLTFTAVLSMWVLSALLGPAYGPSGVAFAYALPVIVLFLSLWIIAGIHLKRLEPTS